jgi:hypothetical protein
MGRVVCDVGLGCIEGLGVAEVAGGANTNTSTVAKAASCEVETLSSAASLWGESGVRTDGYLLPGSEPGKSLMGMKTDHNTTFSLLVALEK